MTPEQIERIFDLFYSDKTEGKGLGLSSLFAIAKQHNGFIQVDSKIGVGSSFTVFFPSVVYRDGADLNRSNGTDPGSSKGRVLLADDDARIPTLIASILEGEGFTLTNTADGREALKRVEEDGARYDLFVLDCTMPKLSGTDVYRQIRSAGLTAPIVLISGYH